MFNFMYLHNYRLYLAKKFQVIFTSVYCIIYIFIFLVNNFIHQADQFDSVSLCIIHSNISLHIRVNIYPSLGNKSIIDV